MEQMELFPKSIIVRATIAIERGDACVVQCSWCGLLVCSDTKVELGLCPVGHVEPHSWWRQEVPVGPFRGSLEE